MEAYQEAQNSESPPSPVSKPSFPLKRFEAQLLQRQIDNTFKRLKIPILQEDGSNFCSWSKQFELAARTLDIKNLNILHQHKPAGVDAWIWRTAQATMRSWLMASMDLGILEIIRFKDLDTVADIWLQLNRRFGVSKSIRRVELCQEFMELINLPTSTPHMTALMKGERIHSKLRDLGTTPDDLFHDWFIAFVTRQEPLWASIRFREFYATGTIDHPDIQNLDIQEVMRDFTQYKNAHASATRQKTS